MSKHTPGPWDFEPAEEHSIRPTVASIGDYRVVRAGQGARGYDLHGQDEDDARLIAAAPDLLEALKELLFIARHGNGLEAHYKAHDRADAAIAKAEGRS